MITACVLRSRSRHTDDRTYMVGGPGLAGCVIACLDVASSVARLLQSITSMTAKRTSVPPFAQSRTTSCPLKFWVITIGCAVPLNEQGWTTSQVTVYQASSMNRYTLLRAMRLLGEPRCSRVSTNALGEASQQRLPSLRRPSFPSLNVSLPAWRTLPAHTFESLHISSGSLPLGPSPSLLQSSCEANVKGAASHQLSLYSVPVQTGGTCFTWRDANLRSPGEQNPSSTSSKLRCWHSIVN